MPVLLEGGWGTFPPLAVPSVPLVCGGGFEIAEALEKGEILDPDTEGKPEGRTLPERIGLGPVAEPDAKADGKPDALKPPEGRGAAEEPDGSPGGPALPAEGRGLETIPEIEGTPDGPRPIPDPDRTPVDNAAALVMVVEAASVTPVMPPVAATEMTLEETASAAVTGQIVVASWMVSVTRTVEICSGEPEARLVREAELAGQLVTEAAQLRTVRIDVVRTVIVVSSSASAVVAFIWGMAVADPEAVTGKIVEVTVSSGSQVSSSGWVAFVGFVMAAPSALPEKSRREA